MTMKIILTGDRGFLGKQLKQRLPQTWEIIGLNRTHGDLTQLSIVQAQLQKYQPDIIIHAAAMADVRQCDIEREAAYQSHVVLSETLAQAAKEQGSRFIFISSDQVYDKFTAEIKTEATLPRPQTYYGELKLIAEKKVQALIPNAIILRLGWQALADKQQPHGIYRLVANTKLQEQRLAYHPQAWQYPCDVRLTCAVVQAACEQALAPGIYNVAQTTPLQLGRVFAQVFQSLGLTAEQIESYLQADNTRENVQLCAAPLALEQQGFTSWPLKWGCSEDETKNN